MEQGCNSIRYRCYSFTLEANPSLAANESSGSSDTVVQIKQAIMNTSKPLPSQDGHDDNYGYGMLQVENLIASFA